MRKFIKVLPLLLVASLTACNNLTEKKGVGFYFNAELSYSIYAKSNNVVKKIKDICQEIDNISDPYEKRSITNVYDINQTNDKIEISEKLFNLLEKAKKAQETAQYFNPLIGSLSNKWKECLANHEILSNDIIQEELEKINNSSLVLDETNGCCAQRIGEAQIDLGGIAKGFALDRIYETLKQNNVSDYLINCGSSSVLLGENGHTQAWNSPRVTTYTVSLRYVPGTKFKAQNCVISSSGNDIQGVEISGTTYSHIINPTNGSAIMENDAVIVITSAGDGYLGDALSTSMMMNTVEEIKEIEKEVGAKTIVVKNKQIVYSHPDIKFVY